MFRLFVFSVIVASVCCNVLVVPSMDGRIVGGQATTIESIPYQISLRYLNSHTCGGSILNTNTVLTAAHCVYHVQASLLSVQYGLTVLGGNKNVIPAARIVINQDYDPYTNSGDIALVILKAHITVSDTAKPIAMATKAPLPNTKAVVSGWGRISEGGSLPTVLQRVDVTIMDRAVCEEQYKNLRIDDEDYYNDYKEVITKDMLCAGVNGGGKDACQGDSGGPLVVAGVQVGIVSWGAGCARPSHFGIYTNVAEEHAWIMKNLK